MTLSRKKVEPKKRAKKKMLDCPEQTTASDIDAPKEEQEEEEAETSARLAKLVDLALSEREGQIELRVHKVGA